MFEAAAEKFAASVGDNELIPVPNLDLASKCRPLCLVTKKYRRWCWQSPYFEVMGFKLEDVLKKEKPLDESLLKTTEFLKKYEKTNKLSLKGKLGGKLKGILEMEVSGSDSIDIETKFGMINKVEIEPNDMINYVNGLQLDISHQALASAIEHKRKVLCLVCSCLKLGEEGDVIAGNDVKAEEMIGEGENTVLAKIANAKEDIEMEDQSTRSMTVPQGVPLAYSVFELDVDLSNGTFKIMLDKEKRGGFHGEDTTDAVVEVDDILVKEERDRFAPIVDMEEDKRKALREAVLAMCATAEDIDMGLLMVKQAHKAVEAHMEHDDERVEDACRRFQADQTSWQVVIEAAGFTIAGDKIQYPKESSPGLHCMRCLFEALIELEDDSLEHFIQVNQERAAALLYMFQDAIEKTEINTSDPHLAPIYSDANPGQAFAAALGFQVLADGKIQPPAKTTEVQGAARALYALWWSDKLQECSPKAACTIL